MRTSESATLASMKTRVKGSWVVGHHSGRHTLIKNGEVVFENDGIIFVGLGSAGDVDEEIDGTGMLVAPGFIDTHVHAGYQAQKRMITDVGRPDYFGQPFLEFDVARAGATVGGDPRFFSDEDKRLHDGDPWALFTAVELIRNVVTDLRRDGCARAHAGGAGQGGRAHRDQGLSGGRLRSRRLGWRPRRPAHAGVIHEAAGSQGLRRI